MHLNESLVSPQKFDHLIPLRVSNICVLKGPFPDSFFFICVFSKQLVVNRIPKLLDSKCASLVSERIALPPEPQPQPVASRCL